MVVYQLGRWNYAYVNYWYDHVSASLLLEECEDIPREYAGQGEEATRRSRKQTELLAQ